MKRLLAVLCLLLSSSALAQQQPSGVYGIDFATNGQSVGASGHLRLMFDGTSLKQSINGSAYTAIGGGTGNWTFSGNNADVASGAMGLGTSGASSLTFYPTTLTISPNTTLGMAAQAATNTTALTIAPNVADGVSSVALVLNSTTSLTSGKLLSVRNAGIEQISMGPMNGGVTGNITLSSSILSTADFINLVNTGYGTTTQIAQGPILYIAAAGDTLDIMSANYSTLMTQISTAGMTVAVPLTVNVNGIATAQTVGASLQNTTAATAGVIQQYSPMLEFQAHLWFGGANTTDKVALQLQPYNTGNQLGWYDAFGGAYGYRGSFRSTNSSGIGVYSVSGNGWTIADDIVGAQMTYGGNSVTVNNANTTITGALTVNGNGTAITVNGSSGHSLTINGNVSSVVAQALFEDSNGKTHFGIDAAGLPSLGSYVDWREDWRWWTGSLVGSSTVLPNSNSIWTLNSTGTGTNSVSSATGGFTGSPVYTYLGLTPGTPSGNASEVHTTTLLINLTKLSNSYIVLEWDGVVSQVGTGNKVTYAMGFATGTPATSAHPNGWWFQKADSDTNWQIITDDGTTSNSQNSGVAPVANTPQTFRIEYYGSTSYLGTRTVKFYIDNSLVGTSTANVYATLNSIGWQFGIKNSAVSTGPNLYIGPLRLLYNRVAAPLAP